MINVIISGCNGRMGHVVEEICNTDPDINVVAGFDVLGSSDRDFPSLHFQTFSTVMPMWLLTFHIPPPFIRC